MDKALTEYGDKVPESDREAVVKANDEVKGALKGDDTDRIRQATDSLMQAFQRVGQAMYAGQQQAQPAGGQGDSEGAAGASAGGDPDVVEGEIVDEEGAAEG